MHKIVIEFQDRKLEAEVYPTPTGEKILSALPLEGNVNTWGDEIYFSAPIDAELEEGAKEELEMNDLAYWPGGKVFCIFFGPTPASSGKNPVAVSPVNVFGKILETTVDLKAIAPGEPVKVRSLQV
jgi:hypothetical protein